MAQKCSERSGSLPTTLALLALLAAMLVLPLTLAARAEGYVYWTKLIGISLGRANLDGTDANQSFIGGAHGPYGVAVNATHIYWTNLCVTGGCAADDVGTIGRANLDGSGVNQSLVTGITAARFIAVDDTHVYWANNGTDTIGRANLDGADANPGFIAGPTNPTGVAVDAGHVYWGNYGTNSIGRANLNGTGVDPVFIPGADSPRGVAVDGGHVYWSNYNTDTIGRANLDGSGANPGFIAGAIDPRGVAVDAGHVYWANGQAIGRANLDGTGVVPNLIATAGPSGIAVDALSGPPDTTPPESKITKRPPNKTENTRAKFKFKSNEPGSTFECKKDKKPFKPCSSPTQMKHLDEGKHKFKVRATDPAGNTDPTPAKDKFRVLD